MCNSSVEALFKQKQKQVLSFFFISPCCACEYSFWSVLSLVMEESSVRHALSVASKNTKKVLATVLFSMMTHFALYDSQFQQASQKKYKNRIDSGTNNNKNALFAVQEIFAASARDSGSRPQKHDLLFTLLHLARRFRAPILFFFG